MKSQYKAKISLKNLADFKIAFDSKEKIQEFGFYFNKIHYGLWGEPIVSKAQDIFKYMFNTGWISKDYSLDVNCLDRLETLISYTSANNLLWNVDYMNELVMLISFSNNKFIWHRDYCELVEIKNFDNLTLSELKAIGSGNSGMMNLPIEMNAVSVDSIKHERADVEEQLKQLKTAKDDCSQYKTKELAEIKQSIEKLEHELRQKKKDIHAQLQAKMDELNKQIMGLEKQLYMMESQIYVIRSYFGETMELKQVRTGTAACFDNPLIVNQKIMYLDEDLARIVSVYKEEITSRYSMFEDAVKYVDDLFESFCPQERCITFFRLSKNASYRYYNREKSMYETEELIHGKKMGFILRDSANAFIGWLDEQWGYDKDGKDRKVTFHDNLMYKPGETSVSDVDDRQYGTGDHDTNTMLSRLFAMSVVQGILDNGNIIHFPEKVNIMSPGKYIKFNYATAWLADDRFGDFASLVENLNKRTKVKDVVLITYNKNSCKGRGEHDRAYDCVVPEGLNRVNYLESNEYGKCVIYVSAKKRYSTSGATANVLLQQNEYINITYMNSIWLKYYIQTKKMGLYCEDYAKMIKHLKKAVEELEKREQLEMSAIKVYYPEADQIPEWQIKLSHWKMKNNIRFMTDFQARRIAKYLKNGDFYEIKHLFDTEQSYDGFLKLENYSGSFEPFRGVWVEKQTTEFHPRSQYAKDNFHIDISNYSCDQDKNQKKINEKLPGMLLRVEERLLQEYRKLEMIRRELVQSFSEKGVLEEMKQCEELYFVDRGRDFQFLKIEELDDETKTLFMDTVLIGYPEYVRTTELWRIAYYNHIYMLYHKLVKMCKILLHEHFMQDIIRI